MTNGRAMFPDIFGELAATIGRDVVPRQDFMHKFATALLQSAICHNRRCFAPVCQ